MAEKVFSLSQNLLNFEKEQEEEKIKKKVFKINISKEENANKKETNHHFNEGHLESGNL